LIGYELKKVVGFFQNVSVMQKQPLNEEAHLEFDSLNLYFDKSQSMLVE
jgi:hypothetical protein